MYILFIQSIVYMHTRIWTLWGVHYLFICILRASILSEVKQRRATIVYVWVFMGNIKSNSRTRIHFDIVHDSLKWIRKLINSCFVSFFWCSDAQANVNGCSYFFYINLINVCYAYSHTHKITLLPLLTLFAKTIWAFERIINRKYTLEYACLSGIQLIFLNKN